MFRKRIIKRFPIKDLDPAMKALYSVDVSLHVEEPCCGKRLRSLRSRPTPKRSYTFTTRLVPVGVAAVGRHVSHWLNAPAPSTYICDMSQVEICRETGVGKLWSYSAWRSNHIAMSKSCYSFSTMIGTFRINSTLSVPGGENLGLQLNLILSPSFRVLPIKSLVLAGL